MSPPRADDVLDRFGLRPEGLDELIEHTRELLAAEVAVVVDERATGPIPVVEYDEVAGGRVPSAVRDTITRRGCVVVRRTFEPGQAEAWDRVIADYLDSNGFADLFADRYGERAATGSGIIGVYWSRPQVRARQHERMVVVRRFLNGFWRHRTDDACWFDPDLDIGYPDRLRRRAPGATARGLQPHVDAASARGWQLAENVESFAEVFAGRPELHDPWDAAHRSAVVDEAASAPSSVFRSFQGWTALTRMRPDDGGLHLLPIPAAVSLAMLTGLRADAGGAPLRATPDEALLPALVPIPEVEPGDTVWWHGDLFHSVAPASNTDRWSNVMYIGVAPACPRNEVYRATMFERFATGRSPVDFPAEDFEVDFTGRAGPDDLNDVGRTWFGLDPLVRT